MIDSLSTTSAEGGLSTTAAAELQERGFVVIDGPVPVERVGVLTEEYDAAVAAATGDDIRVGNSSTRVSDFVNRGAIFDDIYLFPPLLDACHRVIDRPFKLSSFQARTLPPGALGQGLHVDVRSHSADWPLLGFILMIDAFGNDNGATRFVPGSHHWAGDPATARETDGHEEVLARGEAGSLIVFNGSVWHGHGTNSSAAPRRSLQGAYIPREGRSGTDFSARMTPETRARLSPVAHQLLAG